MTVSLIIAAALAFQGGAQQFDLICTGTLRSSSTNVPEPRLKEVNDRARVDLARGLWCWDTCEDVNDFVEINAAELILSHSSDAQSESFIRIDRVTGRYTSNFIIKMEGSNIVLDTTGRCTKALYTPIPQAAF